MGTISISDFEKKVWVLEGVLIKLRTEKSATVKDYDYKRCAPDGYTVSSWLEKRIWPLVNDIEVVVIAGNYKNARGNTKLGNLRSGYKKSDA